MPEVETTISVKNVAKSFILPHKNQPSSIKSFFINPFSQKKGNSSEKQHILKGVSFDIKKGEFFGIVGRNGSGKSTLLKILAGIYKPDKGSVGINGRLVPFIELGVGFNPELTGRENVYLSGALMGFSTREVSKKYKKIVEFAELERFMDQKLKNYSSGMQVRLAFSVATMLADSDILLIDEVLAVGDADFQRKCFSYFRRLKRDNKTVVFVSHDMSAVEEYCDKAVLIEDGEIVEYGPSSKIASLYSKMFAVDSAKLTKDTASQKRWGDKAAVFTDIDMKKRYKTDDVIEITLKAQANESIENAVFGFAIKNETGAGVLGTNTKLLKKKHYDLKEKEKVTITWSFPNILNDGQYSVEPAIVYDASTVADWWQEAAQFTSFRTEPNPYLVSPPIDCKVQDA